MNRRIYLDNNATTFLDPRVKEAVVHHLEATQGNPSSIHSYGQEARAILIKARKQIADYLAVSPNEIIFTSSGTEALNMILRGVFGIHSQGHLITASTEHASVYATAKAIVNEECSVTFLDPGLWGAVTPEAVQKAIKPTTRLIALMAVNNETGVKTDIEVIAALAQENKIPFLVDGVGLLGKESFEIPPGVSAMCFSGHKLHAPKGIGFAFVRNTLKLDPLIIGGEQEFGKRGGTENLPGIVGLATAVSILQTELPAASKKMQDLRDRLEHKLLARLEGVAVNGLGPRVANTVNLSFECIEGETLLAMLDMEGVAVSHGSACASGALEPSRVLLNMGISRAKASTSIRISLSRFTTEDEIEEAVEIISSAVTKLRK